MRDFGLPARISVIRIKPEAAGKGILFFTGTHKNFAVCALNTRVVSNFPWKQYPFYSFREHSFDHEAINIAASF